MAQTVDGNMKICCHCSEPSNSFSPDKRAYDRLQSICRPCRNLTRTDYYKKPKHKATEQDRKWRINNPGKKNAHLAKRNAAKLQRTPKWLSKQQLIEIETNYILAKELSWLSESPLEVDHIVPLQGSQVSGLHVPWNLQVIPAVENQKKGNRS